MLVYLLFLFVVLYLFTNVFISEGYSPGTLIQLATSSPYYYYGYPYGAWGHYNHYPYFPYDYGRVYYPHMRRRRRRALRRRRPWWRFW